MTARTRSATRCMRVLKSSVVLRGIGQAVQEVDLQGLDANVGRLRGAGLRSGAVIPFEGVFRRLSEGEGLGAPAFGRGRHRIADDTILAASRLLVVGCLLWVNTRQEWRRAPDRLIRRES